MKLAKQILYYEYHVKEVRNIQIFVHYLFYIEYGIEIDLPDFEGFSMTNADFHTENIIHSTIMHDDKEIFSSFIERESFNEYQQLASFLLELCCYHGAVNCFKLLRTEFEYLRITQTCLRLSFLGRNQEIFNECLKYQKPDKECMKYAIISHIIDFVTYLNNEFNIEIDLKHCGNFNNLESFLVYFDQTNDLHKCFVYSAMFNILCEYFLSLGANVNEKNDSGQTALHISALINSIKITELFISHGANINDKDNDGQ